GNDVLVFFVVERRRFAGGADGSQAVSALLDMPIDELEEVIEIDVAVAKGSYQRDGHAGELFALGLRHDVVLGMKSGGTSPMHTLYGRIARREIVVGCVQRTRPLLDLLRFFQRAVFSQPGTLHAPQPDACNAPYLRATHSTTRRS